MYHKYINHIYIFFCFIFIKYKIKFRIKFQIFKYIYRKHHITLINALKIIFH